MTLLVAYLGVLVAAVVPWFELFAIPPAIALGLSPVAVGLVAGTANAVTMVAIVLGWGRLSAWWERRRGRPFGVRWLDAGTEPSEAGLSSSDAVVSSSDAGTGAASRRGGRARRVFDRYGVPGLALQGPILSGIYLAAILALSLGAARRRVLAWSLLSVAVWSAALVVVTVAGVDLARGAG